ncbi:hypothetical protein BKA62DRAFT_513321 [Auriculariales sp. MPI-PUGE-AT-0066]|nr:hypothetical protein BKA62DRAFT_513321 [Auriculariales sp. MPI-PUGE-AT-0066]
MFLLFTFMALPFTFAVLLFTLTLVLFAFEVFFLTSESLIFAFELFFLASKSLLLAFYELSFAFAEPDSAPSSIPVDELQCNETHTCSPRKIAPPA